MSIIDTAGHSIINYTGKEKAFTGQRLAKFSWKTDAMGIKRDSKCVSLPVITAEMISANLIALTPAIIGYLHSVQDKMIREQLDSASVTGASTITSESISIAAVCEWLDSNDDSGRLTKESVGAWFDSNVSEMLAAVLADKLGIGQTPTTAESDKVIAAVTAFRGKVASLAGGKTVYEPKICRSLISALELADSGDALAGRFIGRLNKMIVDSESQIDLIDLL